MKWSGLICSGVIMGCLSLGWAGESSWTLTPHTVLEGFLAPESVLCDPDGDRIWVSNIESAPDAYWKDDGRGFLSLLSSEPAVVKRRWLNSRPAAVFHAPKGMCLSDGWLYFTDNSRLMRCSARDGQGLAQVAVGFIKANDLVAGEGGVWMSDTVSGKIFFITGEGRKREIPAPPGANGLTWSRGRLYGVSWSLHEIYELDPDGHAAPRPFGLADHFTSLDGIEALEDGSFLVSDMTGGKVAHITADRKTVTTLVKLKKPADIGLDRKRGRLYVPQLSEGKVAVFRVKR